MATATTPGGEQGSAVVPYSAPAAPLNLVKPINPILIAGTGLTPPGSVPAPVLPATSAPPCTTGACPYTGPGAAPAAAPATGPGGKLAGATVSAAPAWWAELYAGIPLWVWLLVGALVVLVVSRR